MAFLIEEKRFASPTASAPPFRGTVAAAKLALHRYVDHSLVRRSAVAKLESFGDNLVKPCTKMQQSTPKVSPIIPPKAVASYT
jgi:hypothetical protein